MARASTACDAINSGALNHSTTYAGNVITSTTAKGTTGFNAASTVRTAGQTTDGYVPAGVSWVPDSGTTYDFAAGDVVTLNAAVTAYTSNILRAAIRRGTDATTQSTQGTVLSFTATGTQSVSFTVTGTTTAVGIQTFNSGTGNGTIVVTATCAGAAPPPTVTSLSPDTGPAAGGNTVVLTGTGFTGATAVAFGGTPAAGYTVNSATQIAATAPAGAAGTIDVTVTTPDGISAAGAGSQYSYVAAPTISNLSPAVGPTAGGTGMTISGTGFVANATAVQVGGVSATNVVVQSATALTATTPARTAGPASVSVSTVGGTGTLANGFTYVAPPTVTSVTPNSGPLAGGNTVTVTGSGLAGTSAVTFGGTAATNVQVAGDGNSLTVTVPAHTAGTVAVAITTTGGTGTLASGYAYVAAPAAPVVTTPANGSVIATTTPAVTGTAAANATVTVFVDGASTATTTANGSGNFSVTLPSALADGLHTAFAQASGPGGTSANSNTNSFTVDTQAPAAPVVAVPSDGATITSQTPTISGTAAANATVTVFIDGSARGTTTANGGGSFNFASPPLPLGSHTVYATATDAAGNVSTGSNTNSFTIAAIPTVTGVSPSQGTTAGGTGVTITGTGFTGASAVTFAGAPATSVTVVSATSISAVTPGGTAGAAAVAVTTPAGTSTTNGTFTYLAPTTATPQTVTTAFNTARAIVLSGTNMPTSYAVTTAPTHGSLSGTAPNLSYMPTSGYRGADSFQFTTTNNAGTSAPATVDITVENPTLTLGTAPPAGTRGNPYSFAFTASGGTAPYSYAISSGALPVGLSFANGTLSGTPAASGSFPITVTVTDSTPGNPPVTATGNYTIAIGSPTLALAPPTGGLPDAATGSAYNQTISAAGGTPSYSYTVTAGALPAGITLSAGGILSGTPTQGGSFAFTITATDSSSAASGGPYSASANYTLLVDRAVVTIAPGSLPAASVGSAYSQTVTASGGTAPYSFAVTAGALPSGLTLAATGIISGTPSAGGTFNVTVTVTDSSTGAGAPFTASRAYALTVSMGTVTITPTTLSAGESGVVYSQTLTASGGTAPYSYAITTGTLPAGLTLSSAGTLAGTPTQSGSFAFAVAATDSSTGAGPYAGTRSYALTIAAPTVVLAPATLAGATVGSAYSESLTASGGAAPYSYAVTAGALPAGITLSTGGTLSGTPGSGGSFTFTVTATDGTASGNGGPYSASASYTLTVAAPSVTIAPATLPAAAAGAPYSQTLTAGGGTAPYSYTVSAGALPAGVTLSVAGLLSGTPTQSGNFTFAVTATDTSTGAGPYTGTRSYTMAVAAPTLTLVPTTLDGATVGAPFSQTLTASGGTGPYRYAVTAGALPTGMTLSDAGTLAGTPNAGGSFTFTVTATDATTSGSGGPYAASASYMLAVASPTVTITPADVPGGAVDVAYGQALTASGGTAPYSYAITAGALPAGLTLSGSGTLSGTPTQSGSFTFSVTVTDASTGAGPYAGTTGYTLTIAAPPPPVAQNAPQQTVAASTAASAQSVSIDLSALVTGKYTDIQIATQPQHGTVVIAPTDGRFVATFTAAVGYTGADGFGFVAIGQGGRSAEARVDITIVGAVPVAPDVRGTTISGQPVLLDLTGGATGGPFTAARIVVTSPADAVTTELIEGGGAGNRTYQMRVVPGGRFSGTATVQYTLSNAFGTSAAATATITVVARPDPTQDPNVTAISTAQAESTRRFAQTQASNFLRRAEQLHDGGSASRGSPFGITVGLPVAGRITNPYRSDASPAQSDVVMRKMDHANAVWGSERAGRRYPLTGAMVMGRQEVMGGGQGGFADLRTPEFVNKARDDAGGTGIDADEAEGTRRIGSVAMWSGGAISVGTRDATTRRERLSITSGGLSAGLDVKLGEALTIGAGGGYGSDRTRVGRDETARVKGDSYVGAIYGSLAPADGFFLDAVLGVGRLSFDTRRIAVNDALTVGRRKGSMIFGSMAGGIDRMTDRFSLSVYGRADAMKADLDAYREHGAGIYDLGFAHRDLTSLSSTLGARGSLGSGAVTPRGRFEWRHEFRDTGIQALDYADLPGYTYRLRGDGWLRDALSVEIGLGYVDGSGWQLGIDIGGEFGSAARAGTARVAASKEF